VGWIAIVNWDKRKKRKFGEVARRALTLLPPMMVSWLEVDAKSPPTTFRRRWIGAGACDLAPSGNPHHFILFSES